MICAVVLNYLLQKCTIINEHLVPLAMKLHKTSRSYYAIAESDIILIHKNRNESGTRTKQQ